MKHRILMFLAIACLMVPAAAAGTGSVGVSAGQSSLETDDMGGGSMDLDDTGWKAFGGYDFIKFFGVEGSYNDMGSMEASEAGIDLNSEISGFGLYARGILPLGKKVELFGKVGMVFWDADTEVTTGLTSVSGSDSGNDVAFGAGASFNVVEKFAIRLEFERFDIEDTEAVDFGSLGFAFRF